MKFTDKKEQPNKTTYNITVNLAWEEIEKAQDKAVKELTKTSEIEGFRKGKAPEKLVREKLGEQKILEEASKYFLQEIYVELIKKYDLKPYLDPKIKLLKAPVKGEWEIRFEIATTPVITKMADYKKIAKEVKGDAKKDEIWVPGKDEGAKVTDEKAELQKREAKKNEQLQKIFNELIEKSEIEISPLILEEEVNRRLVELYEEIRKLGLTTEQYLQTKKETAESLRAKIEHEVKDIYKSEFLLDKIADEEKITVDEADLEKILKTAKTEEEKKQLSQNSYFYSRILRKQKTLDFLMNL